MKELVKIQSELKAPKGQYNSFGKYHYRSAEDIMEALKPILAKYDCELTVSDDIVEVGNRIYVKATATLENKDGKTKLVTAFAREAEKKTGMDESQITGAASSYARKYALNGLFCIDDTKDADHESVSNPPQPKEDPNLALAMDEIKRATSGQELLEIYNRWAGFQSNPKFKSALTKRKGEVQ